jgi:hypothetical protein
MAASWFSAAHADALRVLRPWAGLVDGFGPSGGFRPVAMPLDGLIEHPLKGTHWHANKSSYADRGYVPAFGRLISPSAGQVEVPFTGFRDTNR